jgi:hypothetical protein
LIIKPVTEINGNSKDTDYPSAKAVYDYGQNIVTDTQITATAQGNAITIESSKAPLQNLKLYGKTTQDGIPTPDNPIELKSVGDSGSYSVDVYGGKNFFDINGNVNVLGNSKEQTSFNSVSGNILTANANGDASNGVGQKIKVKVGVPITFSAKVLSFGTGVGVGLFIYENGKYVKFYMSEVVNETCKVTFTATVEEPIFTFVTKSGTGGQVTDIQVEYGESVTPYEPCNKKSITFTDTLRGVNGIADVKDFARGVKIQRLGFEKISDYAETTVYTLPNGNKAIAAIMPNKKEYTMFTPMCTNAKNDNINLVDGTFCQNPANFLFVGNSTDTYDTLITKYGDGYVLYELATPIETPLSETELNAYRQLYTNKPNTTILSEADMEVEYYINKPNAQAIGNIHSQINKDYLKLQQAIISTGGNV